MNIKEIESKTIIAKTKNSFKWFGITYNTNFYRGCTHGCIYCDSRSECYGIENFNDVEVKINAPELLDKALSSKRRIKGTVGTGAMTDPYISLERKYRLTRQCLEIINKYNYPITIITKSDLILDDLNLLDEINKKAQVTVIFTITTTNDALAKKIEPFAPSPTKRLAAIKTLNSRGIYTGVLLMPVLPFIEDTKENIVDVVKQASEAGGKFIIPMFGVTLRGRQRDYYYNKLDEYFPGLKEKYQKTYKEYYTCYDKDYKELYSLFKKACNFYNLVCDMSKIDTWERRNKNIELGVQLELFK